MHGDGGGGEVVVGLISGVRGEGRRNGRREGYEEQRAAWEQQYAEAHARWEAHKKQVEDAENSEVAAAVPATYSSGSTGGGAPAANVAPASSSAAPEGSLASDEALQALREKLSGGGA